MSAFPAFNVFLFLRVLVPAVGEDIQELERGNAPHFIPAAPHRFARTIYIGNPAPTLCKTASAVLTISFILSAFFGSFFASFSK